MHGIISFRTSRDSRIRISSYALRTCATFPAYTIWASSNLPDVCCVILICCDIEAQHQKYVGLIPGGFRKFRPHTANVHSRRISFTFQVSFQAYAESRCKSDLQILIGLQISTEDFIEGFSPPIIWNYEGKRRTEERVQIMSTVTISKRRPFPKASVPRGSPRRFRETQRVIL